MPETSAAVQKANDFLTFINASPTPYHAVHNLKGLLEKAGFQYIRERDNWSTALKPGGKYYLTRNASTLITFAIGKKWKQGNPISMVGAHTDSCCLRIKPNSARKGDGFLQIGVEQYGGGLWHTWFDRDLSIAGRAMVQEADGSIKQKLIKLDRPICRIPTLAPHFGREESFAFNKEAQLFPIAGLVAAELNRQGKTGSSKKEEKDESEKESSSAMPFKPLTERHHPYIVEIIAEEAGVSPESIIDFEMILYDTQPSCLGGLNNELIFSARLDDLMMSYCAVEGLISSLSSSSALDDDSTIRLTGLFDHEEVGSLSTQGADSNIMPAVLRRLSVLPSSSDSGSDSSYDKLSSDADTSTAFEQSMACSFLLSADMSHSVNPNYPGKYEAEHRPEMNKGVVIKVNANQRYTTNAPGVVLIQQLAQRAEAATHPYADQNRQGVPLQFFVVRNDTACGGTIGPMSAAKLGVRTLDLGNPQLSMHSIRETGGAYDVEHAINLFNSFFTHFADLNERIEVD